MSTGSSGKVPRIDPLEFKGLNTENLKKRKAETQVIDDEEIGLEALVPDYLAKKAVLIKKKERIIREGSASKEKILLLKAILEDRKSDETAEILAAAQVKLEEKLGEKVRIVGEAVKKKKKKKEKTPEQKVSEKIKKKFSEKRKKLKGRARNEEGMDLSTELKTLKEEEAKVLLTEKNKVLLQKDPPLKKKK